MVMDFRGLQVWKQVWEMTFFVWNRVRIWRTGWHSPTKNSQEYPWGQITPFWLIKRWKISWITWSRAELQIDEPWGNSHFWSIRGCASMVFLPLCPKQVIKFCVRLSTGYIACCRKQGITFLSGVDKTRNMEHSGTFRNILQHPGTWKNN